MIRKEKKHLKRSGVRLVTAAAGGGHASRLILLLSFSIGMALIAGVGSGIGYGQANIANLFVQSIELQPSGFFLESPGPPITIRATLGNNGTADAANFDVSLQIRREDEANFRADEYCQFVGTASTCKNLNLRAGESAIAIGILPTNNLTAGRYIIRVAIDAKGASQSSQTDDSQETLLLIGVALPELHPTSLVFSPPSPVPQGVQLTVKVQIENTGRPTSPELQVKFEYCLESPTCIEFSSQGFPSEGVRRLIPEQTGPLNQGKPLEISNTLDTTGLELGRYTFRVSFKALDALGNDLDEMDKGNNEITTRLTIGGSAGNIPLCQLSGNVITLGRGVGTVGTQNVTVIYVGVRDRAGKVSLHAFKKSDVDDLPRGSICPEIANSPLSLPAEISSFALDQKVKLLYVGLSNGQMVVVNLDSPLTLVATSPRTVGTAALQALAPRVAGLTTGEVYTGSRDGNLYRVRAIKDSSGNVSISAPETCARPGSSINAVLIFQGNVYFGANSGAVLRIPEGSCAQSSVSPFFTAGRAVRTLATNQLRFGNTLAPQFLVGLEDGKLYVLNIFGQNYSNSPVSSLTQGAAITAVAVNRKDKLAYVGTSVGTIHGVDLSSRTSTCTATIPTQQAVNVLAVDDGGQGDLPASGLVFVGSEDNNLYVFNKNCVRVAEPRTTLGPVRASIVLEAVIGFLGVEGIRALYGGGSGLFEIIVQLSAIP